MSKAYFYHAVVRRTTVVDNHNPVKPKGEATELPPIVSEFDGVYQPHELSSPRNVYRDLKNHLEKSIRDDEGVIIVQLNRM